VGEQILEGALLAVQEYRHAGIGPHIELYVRDDSSNTESTLRNVAELEAMGVIAVLGPILTEALMATALRRTDDALLLLSPTATEGLGLPLNAYTLWDRSRREVDVASTLATWMSEQLELKSFGVLRPDGGARDVVAAVREAVETAGGEILGVEAYASDSTTFEGPITALAAVEPDAVIVLADRARTVLQIAPQLVYYGLRRWVTGGDAHWSDPAVVRRLDASYADFRLVATYLDRVTPDSAWRSFETAYEAEYRKAVANSMFTPLGYDGMRLLLSRLAEPGAGRRGVLGRALRRGGTFRGATGALSVDPGTGELRRDVIVRVLRNGELRVPDRAELLEWAADQRELEEFLKALEEEEEDPEDAGKEETP
jgi:branched-chain amino acid transport system substrate-binding protein